MNANGSYLFNHAPEDTAVEFIVGEDLADFCEDAVSLEKRDAYYEAEAFVNKDSNLRTVGIVYGMRSTGKTIILRQLAGRKEFLQISAYTSIGYGKAMVEDIYNQIKDLYRLGIRYFYIDEVTWASGFTDRAMEFADVWAAFKGVRIILSGTDSLSFNFAMQESLYGRYKLFHTTTMGYTEYNRVVKGSILQYIRSGGVFWDINSVTDYLETSVVRNIYNSIAGLQRETLVGEELRFVTQQEIYAICHSICMSVAKEYFYGHLNRAWNNPLLKNLEDFSRKSPIKITYVKKRMLSTYPLFTTESTLYDRKHVDTILELMRRTGFLIELSITTDAEPTVRPIFAQTGVASEFTLEVIRMLSQESGISPKLIEILEDNADGALLELGCFLTILNFTAKQTDSSLQVSTFRDRTGDSEIDLMVYNRLKKTLHLYEIKRSETAKTDFCKHLNNKELINSLLEYYGADTVVKAILYRGVDTVRIVSGEMIYYYEIGNFLKNVERGEVF